MSEMLVVGRVRKPHGLAGEISVDVVTDFPERFVTGASLLWRGREVERTLVLRAVRGHGGKLLLSFEGIEDVDSARALQGGEFLVPAGQAHPAPEGFFYGHEIRGFSCEDARGQVLGVAAGLEPTPAGPMLSVEVGPGREALVPFTHPIVVDVDREARRIVLDPPEGLLDL
jgi:16S rRNA processing protein RimM